MWYPDVPNPGGPPVIELSSIRFNNQPSHPFSHAGPFMQHHDFQPPNVSINSGISPGKETSEESFRIFSTCGALLPFLIEFFSDKHAPRWYF